VLRLIASVLGRAPAPEAFRWCFEENPIAPPNIHLAMHKDDAIGVCSHVAFPMFVDGDDRIVSAPLNVLTHPAYRGKGIFTQLELASEEIAREIDSGFMLALPNRVGAPIFLHKLGWRTLGGPRLLLAPERLLWRRRKPAPEVEPLETFGEWVDEIFDSNKARWRRTIRRSAEYLNWRYAHARGRRYDAYAVMEHGKAIGYVILGIMNKRGFRTGYVADVMVREDRAEHYGALQRWAARTLANRGVDFCLQLEHSDAAPPLGAVRNGFLPLPKRVDFLFKSHRAEWMGERGWSFQMGDIDLFQ
jgi:GNAT superfamily N-acetyltransferase